MQETWMTLETFLRAPITDERPWVVFAACRDADPDLFFPTDTAGEQAAIALCAMCTVRDECRGYALDAREHFGIWGGTNERDRRVEVRRSA